MVTKNERHKIGMRRQNQSKVLLSRTGSEMEELSPKNIANSAWFQDAVTQIDKSDIHLGTRHRFQWLKKAGNW